MAFSHDKGNFTWKSQSILANSGPEFPSLIDQSDNNNEEAYKNSQQWNPLSCMTIMY